MNDIVLVEDEAREAELIARYVEALPGENRLFSFPSAGQALEWVRGHRASLFILDIQLPDYAGTRLGRQLRALPEHRFTPILFTTALAGEELGAYREIKCYDFLVKPFTQDQFRLSVTAALELGRRMGGERRVLRVEQRSIVFEYDPENILFIESFGKRAVIHHTASGREMADEVSGYTLARLLELSGGGLRQCHKSYLVNPGRIERIDRGAGLLWLRDCREAVPIGDKYRGEVMSWRD